VSAMAARDRRAAPRHAWREPARALVVAVGNTLRADDGLGPAFLTWFAERYEVRPPVRLLDGGTGGAGLLEWLEDGDDLLLVDALVPVAGEPGGQLHILDRERIESGRRGLSSAAHELDLGNLIASASFFGIRLRSVQLLGLTTGSTALADVLTEEVRAGLPVLTEALRHRLETLGFRPPVRR